MVVAIDPRVRVCDSLAESANDSPCKSRHFPSILPMFPKRISVTSNPLDARINSSPNSYFAPECPTIALTPNMGSTPTRKPQTLCERFWGNLEGIWRGLVEDVGCMGLDELLILAIETQGQDYIAPAVA
jgi:hypothetical protein